jgi:hypothetical protein
VNAIRHISLPHPLLDSPCPACAVTSERNGGCDDEERNTDAY